MKTKTQRKTIVVFAADAGEFEQRLNAAYEIAGNNLREVHYNDGAGLCAYVTYDATTYIAESLKDEAILRHETLTCADCPYIEVPNDKRVKRCGCVYSLYGHTHPESEACEVLYKHLQMGKCKLRGLESDG